MNQQRELFKTWAEKEGYDTANTYNTDKCEWLWLNPMTADLWRAWQAAQESVQASVELPVKTWQERLNCPLNKRGPMECIEDENRELRAALRAYGQRAAIAVPQWISVKDRLPSPEVLVMVYVPETKYEHADIRFDCIDPNDDDHASWLGHNEHYEHFCVVAKPEGSIGPSADAPYTHWMPLPAAPGAAPSQPQQEAVPEEPSEKDRIDAERYLWLRKPSEEFKTPHAVFVNWDGSHTEAAGSFLDSAIDAAIAMSAAKEPK